MSTSSEFEDYGEDDDSFNDSDFDLDELEMFLSMAENDDLELDKEDITVSTYHGGEIGTFSNLEVASVFKDDMQYNEGKIDKFNEVVVKRIPKGYRRYREVKTTSFVSERVELEFKNGGLYINDVEVGTYKQKLEKLVVNGERLFDMADMYTEEVKGKGSGYGFSSFLHLMAVVSLRDNKGYLEPYEGCDYTLEDSSLLGTVEVTGMNYRIRKTSANVVINKYTLVSAICNDERLKDVIVLSDMEETNDTSYLRNGEFFSHSSPYTEVFDKLHSSIRLITESQIDGITSHVSRWLLSSNEEYHRISEVRKPFSFVGDKNGMFPSPFKARCMNHDDRMFSVYPKSNLWKDNSGVDWYDGKHNSYRTVTPEDNYISLCSSISSKTIRVNEYWNSVAEKAVDELERLQAVQTARIQKELYDKIYGKHGCYYSEKDGLGISWSVTGPESLTYNCIFYSSENPGNEKLFGVWVKESFYYRSPGFKVSRQDINFSKKNYDALVCTYISMISMHEKGDRYDEFISLFTVLTCNSSWKTSDFADNSRFVTTGHMSGNNVSELIVKPITAGKPIRSSEFLYMNLVNRYLKNPPLRNLTPLFRLPLKHMCLEKDLGLAVNWQNREADHETECCRKMIERSRDEYLNQTTVLKFYKECQSYISKMLSVGVDYEETKKVLDITPEEPVLNPVFYIAMCKSCEKEIEMASSTQVQTGFSVNDMVSDRGSMYFDKSRNCWTESKVCDELGKLKARVDFSGPYDCLLKLFKEKHEKFYLIRSKNGRGRREFATQFIESRFLQSYEEKLASGVSLTAPDDQFLSPHKYNEMVDGFTRVLNSPKPVVGSSEDRSFHCGHNMPEALSIACLTHAVVNKVPYFVTLSSIKRCNTSRKCILPANFRNELINIPEYLREDEVFFLSRNKVSKRTVIKVRKHAMQGMHAVISGVLNTTHVKGIENIMQNNLDMFSDSHVFTTQDDVGRAVSISDGVNPDFAQNNYLVKPMRTLNMTLQKNNDRKHVVIEHKKSSYGLLEVNNIMIVSSGMVTQSHIHPHIIIQPLTSDSIIIDIMNVVSNSRQSVFWGDSPSLAWCCYEMSLYTLRMKWLMTKGHINYLKEIKFIPSNHEELISGFYPRTIDAIKIFINFNNDEELDLVSSGTKSLYDNACNHFSKSWKIEQHEKVQILKTCMNTYDSKRDLVYSARTRKGKLRSSVVKPLPPSIRMEVRERFVNYFSVEPRNEDQCKRFLKLGPPEIKSSLRPMTKDDKKPCIIGAKSQKLDLSRKNLICNKLLGCNYRTDLTFEERLKLSSPNFWKERDEELKIVSEEGLEIHSPSGLPVVRFLGGTRFTKPMAFNFSVNIKSDSLIKRPFVYRGSSVSDLRPCLYGRATVETINVLCFATGMINGERFAFYKKGIKGKLSHVKAEDNWSNIVDVKVNKGLIVRYLNNEDWSPLESGYSRHVPGIEGMNTAMLNYGGFLRSSSDRGFKILQEIFVSKGSFMPSFMQDKMPSYPRFHKESIKVNSKRLIIYGDTCISMIQLVSAQGPVKKYSVIDIPEEIVENRAIF